MSKLFVTEFVSLNGVMEAPGGEHTHPHSGWTFASHYGDDHYAYKDEELKESERLLLGRKTYEGFAAAWPERGGKGDPSPTSSTRCRSMWSRRPSPTPSGTTRRCSPATRSRRSGS